MSIALTLLVSHWQTSDRKTGALDLNMGKMAANGPFTPIVIAMRTVVGEKKFNQIRGKGITLHSQVQQERGETPSSERSHSLGFKQEGWDLNKKSPMTDRETERRWAGKGRSGTAWYAHGCARVCGCACVRQGGREREHKHRPETTHAFLEQGAGGDVVCGYGAWM